MNDWLREAGAVAVALVLVTTVVMSGVVPGPVAPAEGATVTDCVAETTKSGILVSTTPYLLGLQTNPNIEACSEFGAGNNSDLSATQSYTHAKGVKDSSSSFTNAAGNRLEGSRALATMEAKSVSARYMNNGTSISTTKTYVNESVEDYYSQIIANIYRDWGSHALQTWYLTQAGQGNNFDTKISDGTNNFQIDDVGQVNVTLPNGDHIEVTTLLVNNDLLMPGRSGSTLLEFDPMNETFDANVNVSENPYTYGTARFDVQDPETTTWDKGYWYASGWGNLVTQAEDQLIDVKNNVNIIVDNVYDDFQAGDLNTTEYLSAITLAHRAGTDWNTTGGTQMAAIQLALLGHSGDVNTTATITTNKSAATYTGTLFYTGDPSELPNGTLAAGETYDLAQLNGQFIMAVQGTNGKTWVEEWSSAKITISELRDADTGNTVNNTTVVEYTTDSTNVSSLKSEIDRLVNLTQKYKAESSGAGGGGDLSLSTEGAAAGALVLVVVGAAVARNRGGNSSGGGRRRY